MCYYIISLVRYFNSLPHTEVDDSAEPAAAIHLHFNSLPHTEVDVDLLVDTWLMAHFNSLPHTEVDGCPGEQGEIIRISTHYLTQR